MLSVGVASLNLRLIAFNPFGVLERHSTTGDPDSGLRNPKGADHGEPVAVRHGDRRGFYYLKLVLKRLS